MEATPDPAALLRRLEEVPDPLDRVLALVRILRGPGGCPWDREQTVESMTPYLQEESFEVVEAISEGDGASFREELGDLLFLVLFLGEIGGERGWGGVADAAEGVVAKLVRRHPHVFGERDALGTDGALRQWEELKRAERTNHPAGAGDAPTVLGERPKGLPALTAAFRTSEKAGAVGFQWPSVADALAKLDEEVHELRREIDAGAGREHLENEIGDVLYSVANLARYLAVDPERALRGTVRKFTDRFRYVERRLAERGRTPDGSSLAEMDGLWNEAKRSLPDSSGGS